MMSGQDRQMSDQDRERTETQIYDIVQRHLDYILKIWAISIPTVALAIAGFGSRSGETFAARILLAVAATLFATFFTAAELFLWRLAYQKSEFGRKKLALAAGETFFFKSQWVRVAIAVKFGLLVGLTWGIYSFLPPVGPIDSAGSSSETRLDSRAIKSDAESRK
jgi:hypothetical protein